MSLELCCNRFELLVIHDKIDYISSDTKFWAIVWDREVDEATGVATGFVVEIMFCPFCGRKLLAPYRSKVTLMA